MIDRDGLLRPIITILLAVTLPLCCCNFRLLLGGPVACHAVADDSARAAPLDEQRHDCCGSSGLSQESGAPDQAPSDQEEPGKSPAPPESSCNCGKSNMVSSSHEEPGPQPSEIVIGAVPPAEMARAAWDRSMEAARPAMIRNGVLRPATSLLRLHCALSV